MYSITKTVDFITLKCQKIVKAKELLKYFRLNDVQRRSYVIFNIAINNENKTWS